MAAAGVVLGTAATIGSTVYSLPDECVAVFVDNLTYYRCGEVWYQPHYLGTGVTFVVVAAPK